MPSHPKGCRTRRRCRWTRRPESSHHCGRSRGIGCQGGSRNRTCRGEWVGHARARSSPTSREMCSRSCSQGERRIVDLKPSVGRSKQTSHQDPEATRRTSTLQGPGTRVTAACNLSSMAAFPGCFSGMSLRITTSFAAELLVLLSLLGAATSYRHRSNTTNRRAE